MVRFLALLLSGALVLASCAKSSVPPGAITYTLPTLQSTGSITTVDALGIAAPTAYASGNPVVPLLEMPSIPTNQGNLGLTLWGTKDGTGAITQLTQAQVQGVGASAWSVHVFFDNANLPVLFRDDSTGYSLAISNESTSQATFTLCDPSGNADSSVTVTNANGTVSAGNVSDGGSCTLLTAAATPRHAGSRGSTSTNVYTLVSSFTNLTKLITTASYAAGYAFALSSILKFKQHKDNPTQVPIGTPIALIAIAAALLFLPTILGVTGATTFNADALVDIDSSLPSYLAEGSLPGIFPSPDPTP